MCSTGMLCARYHALEVDVQHRYVTRTPSGSSSRCAAPVCYEHAIILQQYMCITGILGARYQTLAVDLQHRYFRRMLSYCRSRCAAPECYAHAMIH